MDRAILNPKGQTILIALDTSESMLRNDPDRFSIEGTHLAAAISDLGTNLGVVTFKSKAKVRVPLHPLSHLRDKEAFLSKLTGVKFSGKTNFMKALALVYSELKQAKAPPGTAVIFLTDGKPDLGDRISNRANERQSLEFSRKFRAAGYRIFTIALGDRVNAEFLNKLSAETGAPPTFQIRKEGRGKAYVSAKDLLSAFVKITGAVHDLFEFSEGIEPLEVFPGTKKLLYTMVKKSPEATFDVVTWNGKIVKRDFYFRYPKSKSWNSRCEVLYIDGPEPGVWDVHPRGDLEVGLVLEELPLTLTCHPLDKDEYMEGTPIRFRYSAHFQNSKWSDILKERAKVWVNIISSENRKCVVKDFSLDPKQKTSDGFVFEGAPMPLLSRPGSSETFFAQVHFRLNRRGGTGSSRTSTLNFRLLPQKGPVAATIPDRLDFGSLWTDGEETTQSIQIKNTSARPVQVNADAPEGVQISKSVFDIPSRDSRDLKVILDPKLGKKLGRIESTLLLKVQFVKGDESKTLTVPLSYERYRFQGKEEIDLGKVILHHNKETPFSSSVPGVVVPEGAKGFRFQIEKSGGPEETSWNLNQKEGNLELTSSFPVNTLPGKYNLQMSITRKDGSIPRRMVNLFYELRGIPRLTVSSDGQMRVKGFGPKEVAQTFDLHLDYPSEGHFDLAFEKGRLIPVQGRGQAVEPNDYELAFLSGWNGKNIVPGANYSIQVNAYLSSDLRPGIYKGIMKINLQGKGYPDQPVEIPLEVAIKR